MVGTSPTRAPGARGAAADGARISAMVRIVLMPALRPPARGWRRRARRTAASSSGVRSATAARWRATVASSPRAIGPVSARSAPQRGPVLDARRARAGRAAARSTPAVAASRSARALERDEEVRGDRGGGVVGGAVLVGDARRRASRALAPAPRAIVERARRGAGDRAPGAARARRRRAGRAPSSAGAGEAPRGRRATSRPWRPSSGRRAARRRRRAAAAAISPSGTHSSTTSAPRGSRAAAERAVDVERRRRAGRRPGRCRGGRRRRWRSESRVARMRSGPVLAWRYRLRGRVWQWSSRSVPWR